jgi:hypothetical protein
MNKYSTFASVKREFDSYKQAKKKSKPIAALVQREEAKEFVQNAVHQARVIEEHISSFRAIRARTKATNRFTKKQVSEMKSAIRMMETFRDDYKVVIKRWTPFATKGSQRKVSLPRFPLLSRNNSPLRFAETIISYFRGIVRRYESGANRGKNKPILPIHKAVHLNLRGKTLMEARQLVNKLKQEQKNQKTQNMAMRQMQRNMNNLKQTLNLQYRKRYLQKKDLNTLKKATYDFQAYLEKMQASLAKCQQDKADLASYLQMVQEFVPNKYKY